METNEFNVEEELSKVILANCLTSHMIIAGIRKLKGTDKYVLISTVDKVKIRKKKKERKNFYIPVSDIANFLKDNFNNKKDFKNLDELKNSFKDLLFSIHKEIGIRGLGIDGLCYYLGSHMGTDLPGFNMSNYKRYTYSFDNNNEKKKMSIYQVENQKTENKKSENPKLEDLIKFDLYDKFDACDILYDKSYEVDTYPITIEEQKEWAQKNHYDVVDDPNDKSCFIKIKDGNNGMCNVVASMVNEQTTADKYDSYKLFSTWGNNEENEKKYIGENKQWNDNEKKIKLPKNALKYCNYCNGIYDNNKCQNVTNYDTLLDTSLEIINKKEEQGNGQEL